MRLRNCRQRFDLYLSLQYSDYALKTTSHPTSCNAHFENFAAEEAVVDRVLISHLLITLLNMVTSLAIATDSKICLKGFFFCAYPTDIFTRGVLYFTENIHDTCRDKCIL